MKLNTLLIISALFVSTLTFSHGGENHDKEQKTINTQTKHYQVNNEEVKRANWSDFSSLHPMIVHFPIVLLLLATLSQIASFFVFKYQLNWVTLLLLLGGFLGAYIAKYFLHPHTYGLSNSVYRVLVEHEKYANYTTWLAVIGLMLKVINLFILKDKKWIELVITTVLFASAYTVSETGHYGAQLIHIEGVGVKGNGVEDELNHKH